MSGSDVTSIPLPVEPSSTLAAKKTAREMLQEALKDHKAVSNKNPIHYLSLFPARWLQL
uniref:Uncharacterized protein n=1 Tax=Arion vulgaris TaxID=1028688 RepID=A0A0B7AJY9_9EUPU